MVSREESILCPAKVEALMHAIADQSPVHGHTHTFYKYPARFSPAFARAAIQHFSKELDLVLDPYCGGGTTLVEAMLLRRRVVGNDLNSLATFVAKTKTTPITGADESVIEAWANKTLPLLRYSRPDCENSGENHCATRNLNIPRARYIKKVINIALGAVHGLPNARVERLVRCAILQTAQWALDGRKKQTSVENFRDRFAQNLQTMCTAGKELRGALIDAGYPLSLRNVFNSDASNLPGLPFFRRGNLADLVVTSPPYPGVHMLYHRWQVDGRKETPAPYWIAGCSDGNGASFYNFGDRKQTSADKYFARSLQTLKAIRAVMKRNAYILQLIAFSNPNDHLPRYLQNMMLAGFSVVETSRNGHTWRDVPGRRWYATVQGRTNSSREVLLIHRAL